MSGEKEQALTTAVASTHAGYVADIHQCGKSASDAMNEIGRKLAWIRDNKSYRATHKMFDEFCKDEFERTPGNVSRLIGASDIVAHLKTLPIGNVLPTSEGQVRPLLAIRSDGGGKGSKRTIDMDKVGDIWTTVAEKSEAEGSPRITAKMVQAEVDLWQADDEPYAPAGKDTDAEPTFLTSEIEAKEAIRALFTSWPSGWRKMIADLLETLAKEDHSKW